MIHVRHVMPSDAPAWLRMRRSLWPEGADPEHAGEIEGFFRGTLVEPTAVLIALDGSEALGFAELSVRRYAEGCETDRVAYLEGWFVAPDARRRGVGRALIAASEAWAASIGCRELASDTEIDNGVSTSAHLALGFEEVDRIRCFRKAVQADGGEIPLMAEAARAGAAIVRHATVADAQAFGDLVTELGYPTSRDQMRTRLESILPLSEYLTLAADVEGRTAGFIGAMVRPSYEADGLYGQIMALVVSAGHRRRGVARALVSTVESLLARRGVKVVVVNTANHRTDAHAFYDGAGYSCTGRRYRKELI